MAKLFDSNIPPACRYCRHGSDCPGIAETLCEKRGAVDPDGSCRGFRYDPLRRTPESPAPLKKFDPGDFSL